MYLKFNAIQPTQEFSFVLNALKMDFTFIGNWFSKKIMWNSEMTLKIIKAFIAFF